MKVLIYGAGVLGSLCALRFHQAGLDLTLLARGQRLEDLRQHGLILEDWITGGRTAAHVALVETVEPEDAYDWIIVIMGKHQVPAVLPVLAANTASPNILFIGNNVAGPGELAQAVGAERVMMGFLSAGGTMQGPVVRCMDGFNGDSATLTIGEPSGIPTGRLAEVTGLFERAGFKVETSPDIVSWLKSHAAMILPVGMGLYSAGTDIDRLTRTPDSLVLMIRAVREGLEVLDRLSYPILPARLNIYRWIPEPLLVGLVQRILPQPAARAGLSHAEAARPELRQLALEFSELARSAGLNTPNFDLLAGTLDPAAPTFTESQRYYPPNMRELAPYALGLAAVVAGLTWLVVKPKKR